MRLSGRRGSDNVEDRRGMRVPGGMPTLGCGGLILVLGLAWLTGDDRLQRLGRGEVQPESFTHGSSEQRVEWLRRGLESGDPSSCETF